MGAVGADGELDLEEDLVGGLPVRVAPAPRLRTELGELAGPEGDEGGDSAVLQGRVVRVIRALVPGAGEPALEELVLRGGEPPVRLLGGEEVVAAAPDRLRPQH